MLAIPKSHYNTYVYGGMTAFGMLVAIGAVTFATQLQSPSGSPPFADTKDTSKSKSDSSNEVLAVTNKRSTYSTGGVSVTSSDTSVSDQGNAAIHVSSSRQMSGTITRPEVNDETAAASAPATPITDSAQTPVQNAVPISETPPPPVKQAESPSLLNGVLTPVVTIVDAIL